MAKERKSVGDTVRGVFDELMDALSSPRSTTKREVKTKIVGGDEDLEKLTDDIGELVSKYMDEKEGDVKVSFKIAVTSNGTTREAGVITCPTCGRRNRLSGSREVSGALCGSCKAPLSKAFN